MGASIHCAISRFGPIGFARAVLVGWPATCPVKGGHFLVELHFLKKTFLLDISSDVVYYDDSTQKAR